MYRPNNIKQNILKMLLLPSMLTLFTTYANAQTVNMAPIISYLLSDTVTITPQEIAIDKIKAYADNQENSAPTVQDYINAGVTGVTAENIDDVNNLVTSLTVSEVDTMTEIQAIVEIVINNTSPEPEPTPEPEVSTCISGPAQQLGQIKDSISSAGVADVTVTIAGCSTKTDVNGYYTLDNIVENENAVVNFEKEGYLLGSTNIQIKVLSSDNTASSNYLEYDMYAHDYQYNHESTESIVSSRIDIDASYIDTKENPYSGTMAVKLTILDNDEEALLAAFPGTFKGMNTNGTLVQFETYGLISISLNDSNGNELSLADRETGTLIFNKVSSLEKPDTLPLWYYDYDQGLWIEEGYAELQEDGSYRGEISHLGTWSLNRALEDEAGIYRGHIINEDGLPMSDVRLYAVGENWIASDLTTDENGLFEIEVMPGNSFQLVAYNYQDKYSANYNGTISAIASGEIIGDRI